jgi:hypothetical protein
MPVRIDMAGFHRYGISIGRVPAVSGRIVALGPKGVTVKLNAALNGLDTITIDPKRVVAGS